MLLKTSPIAKLCHVNQYSTLCEKKQVPAVRKADVERRDHRPKLLLQDLSSSFIAVSCRLPNHSLDRITYYCQHHAQRLLESSVRYIRHKDTRYPLNAIRYPL